MTAAVAGSGPRTVGGSGRFGVWGMIPAKRRGAEQSSVRRGDAVARGSVQRCAAVRCGAGGADVARRRSEEEGVTARGALPEGRKACRCVGRSPEGAPRGEARARKERFREGEGQGGAPLVGDMARTRRPHEGDEPGRGTLAPSVGTAWGQATVSICRKARRGAARSTGRRAGHRPVGGPVCGDVAPAGWTVRRDGTRTVPGTGQRLGRPGGTAGPWPGRSEGRAGLRPVGRRAGHSCVERKARQDGGPPGGTGRTAAQPAVQQGSAPVGRKARGRCAGHGSVGRKARQGEAGRGRQRHRAVGRRRPVNWTVWQGGWRDGCRGGAVRGRCAAGPSGVCGRAVRGEGSAGRPAGAADGHDGPTNGKDPLGA